MLAAKLHPLTVSSPQTVTTQGMAKEVTHSVANVSVLCPTDVSMQVCGSKGVGWQHINKYVKHHDKQLI